MSAPTGSGKTLAYALPIIEALSSRIITRLRALIVVPTRDLATQVKLTFDSLLLKANHENGAAALNVVVVTGSTGFSVEQEFLVKSNRLCNDNYDIETEGEGMGSSRADILIATPGIHSTLT